MSNRFLTGNATEILAYLHLGEDKGATIMPAYTNLNGGCSDPMCCSQRHVAGMVSVVSNVSNNRLHRIAVLLGLLPR